MSLMARIKEKPAKALAQASLGLMFTNGAFDIFQQFDRIVYRHEDGIREIAGGIGYWVSRIGLPAIEVGAVLGLGYVAVRGLGIVMDKFWYGE